MSISPTLPPTLDFDTAPNETVDTESFILFDLADVAVIPGGGLNPFLVDAFTEINGPGGTASFARLNFDFTGLGGLADYSSLTLDPSRVDGGNPNVGVQYAVASAGTATFSFLWGGDADNNAQYDNTAVLRITVTAGVGPGQGPVVAIEGVSGDGVQAGTMDEALVEALLDALQFGYSGTAPQTLVGSFTATVTDSAEQTSNPVDFHVEITGGEPTLDFDTSPHAVVDTSSLIQFNLADVAAIPGGGLNPFLVDASVEVNIPGGTSTFTRLDFDFAGLGELAAYSSLTLDGSRVPNADPLQSVQFAVSSAGTTTVNFLWGGDADNDGQFDNTAVLQLEVSTGPAQGPTMAITGLSGDGVQGGALSEELVEALLGALQFGYSGTAPETLTGSFTATVTDSAGKTSNAVDFNVELAGGGPTLDFDSTAFAVVDTISAIQFDLAAVSATPGGGLNPFLVDAFAEVNIPGGTGKLASLNFDFTHLGNLAESSQLTLDAGRVTDADPLAGVQFDLSSAGSSTFGFRWGGDADNNGQFDNTTVLQLAITAGTGPSQGATVAITGISGDGLQSGYMSEELAEALLDALQYGYTGGAPQTLTGYFTATVTDSAGKTSNAVTFDVEIVSQNKAPTGDVTITGTATEGETLTASDTLADADGLGTITYTWKADGDTIGTGATYTLTQAEVGKAITVTASYTDVLGASESVDSAATSAVTNVNDAPTGAVTISGAAAEGQTLTVSDTLADEDGLGSITYTWKVGETTLATGSSYTLTQSEVGKTITVTASYTDQQGTAETVTSAATAAVAAAAVGTPDNDSLLGSAASDWIDALAGDDTIDGSGGADTLTGGTGTDRFLISSGSDTVLDLGQGGQDVLIVSANAIVNATVAEAWTATSATNNAGTANITSDGYAVNLAAVNSGRGFNVTNTSDAGGSLVGSGLADTLTGGTGADSLSGGAGNDAINGLAGNDTIDGGTGIDSLSGGDGDDTYVVDMATDVVVEAENEGTDQINVAFTAGGTYVLGANVENASVTSAAFVAVNLTGNELDNALTGNAAANVLSGGDGNDTLNGGLGSDTMIGGDGDDSYTVNVITDVVNEIGASGNDTVNVALTAAGTYLMTAGVENAAIDNGTAGVNITGSADNNQITGNGAANVLNGGAGDDTLIGGGGNDTLDGGLGNDTVVLAGDFVDWTVTRPTATSTLLTNGTLSVTLRGVETIIFDDGPQGLSALWGTASAFADVLTGTAGNDSINGLAGNDTINGLAGNDTLDGGTGIDSLIGGDGDDTYVVDVATDAVIEAENEGTDQINVAFTAGGTYVLGANVENASVTSAAFVAVNLTGNELDNALTGNAAANVLSGGDGNDTLNGGLGSDTMIGGDGDDSYTVNVITDVVNEIGASGNDTVNVALTAAGTYLMTAGVENAVISNGTAGVNITGSADNNQIAGNGAANVLNGGAGDDTLIGGGGNDTLDGGLGNDTVVLAGDFVDWTVTRPTATSTLLTNGTLSVTLRGVETIIFDDGPQGLSALWGTASAFADVLTGTSGDDAINGLAGNDTINGLAGNDTIDGGTGIDSLTGGDGDDTYVVDVAADVIVEAENEGTDQINVAFTAAGTYVLSGNVENATVTSAATIAANLTGNALDNVLTGNAAANTLNGAAGNDTLDGGVGSDTMIGGDGDDSYTVNVTTDVVNEIGVSGNDTVNVALTAAGTYLMTAGVENAVISNGTAGVNITGSVDNNQITGNSGANLLGGGAGDDTLIGGDGNDTLDGGAGNDRVVLSGLFTSWTATRPTVTDTVLTNGTQTVTLRDVEVITFDDGEQNIGALWTSASAFADSLTGTSGDDALNGLAGNDTINGLAGNDTLDGGAGIDSLIGGDGDDTYVVDVATDVVVEAENEGTDQINVTFTAAGTYVLGANVENASVTSAATIAVNLTGNELDNVLTGNAAANTLNGAAGNDTLDGGAGNDTMIGGAGDDTYTINVTTDVVNESAIGSSGTDTVNVALTAAGTYLMTAGVENAVVSNGTAGVNITGSADNNQITGNAGNNVLIGGAGDDTLIGGAGNDTLDGGIGNDTVILTGVFADWTISRPTATDTVLSRIGQTVTLRNVEFVTFDDGPKGLASLWGNPSAFADVLTGTAGNDSINGLAGNDTINGLAGNDTIDGGTGIDSLSGGDGDDTYVVDVATDVVVEAENEGTDQINVTFTAAGTYVLGANVENATVTSAATIATNLTGNTLDNVLTGNAAANTLNGAAGNDTLDGGAGNDTMIGGAGDDTYTINVTTDVVNESAIGSSGTDTVNVALTAAGTYLMTAGVENAVISNGTAGVNITGSADNNQITGNAGNNVLIGGAGDDTLIGGTGNDTLDGGIGNDTVILTGVFADWTISRPTATDTVLSRIGQTVTLRNVEFVTFDDGPKGLASLWGNPSAFADVLTGTAGNDSINGLAGNDTINGLAGNDTIDGGTGIDSLSGGDGDDTYVVDVATDVVVEAENEGTDQINVTFTAAGTYVLGANVENASVTSAATIAANLTGNALDNVLTGNAAANTLNGAAGNDTLDGGAGNDTMIGGAGDDTYTINVTTDVVNESAIGSSGTDTVNVALTAAGTYLMTSGVENAIVSNGTAGVNITGSVDNNQITGNAGNNVLIGGAGDDTLIGGTGNDTLDGGIGNDTVILTGVFADWTISRPTATDTVLSRIGQTVTLRNVEVIYFDDGPQDIAALWTAPSAFADVIAGTDSNDSINGLAGNDTINGLAGNDTIDGGTGIDRLSGGDGDDTYIVDVVTDVIVEAENEGTDQINVAFTAAGTYLLGANVENATVTSAATIAVNLTGNELDNVLTGNAAANTLNGAAGNDTLDGGAGNDTMIGGAGDDTYTINVTTDVVNESAIGSSGNDTVNVALTAAGTYLMTAGVENAVISNGTASVNITGSVDNNQITGNAGNNVLIGGAGDDTLIGGGGNDTLDGGLGYDQVLLDGEFADWTIARPSATDTVLTRGSQSITLRGIEVLIFEDGPQDITALWTAPSAFADVLTGGEGDDSFNGLAGNDTINGLVGNDTLDGGTGSDSLLGGAGNDTYVVDVASDVVIEDLDDGIDQVNIALAAAGTYVLGVNIENATVISGATIAVNLTGNELDNVLTGNAAANTLNGAAGNDTLDGGAGNDTMIGGAGDDTYTINVTTDVVNESAIGSSGNDTVNVALAAAGTYLMTAGVENAVISNGTAGVNITGSADNNQITGNAGNNVLIGGAGDDTLIGGDGNDTLAGGAGSDTLDLTDAGASPDVIQFSGGTGTVGTLARIATLGLDVITGIDLGTNTTAVDILRFSAADFAIAVGAAVQGGGNLDGNFYVLSSGPTGSTVDLNGTAANANGAIVFVGSPSVPNGVSVYFTTSEAAFSTANSVQIATLTGISTASLNAADLAFVA